MPAKRIIIGRRQPGDATRYEYVLWADVPAANQVAYRSAHATSRYLNATPAELQALRDGLVVERSGVIKASATTTMPTLEATLQGMWSAFQGEISAETPWAQYGRFWNQADAWNASPGIPWAGQTLAGQIAAPGPPTFFALTAVSAFASNKFHFVLFNNGGAATQALLAFVQLVAILPGVAAVTGVAPSVWSLRRRSIPTTAPAGGTFTPASSDSADMLPTPITLHNAPTTAPAGGSTATFNEFTPQADEQKLSTLDAPTRAALSEWGGMLIYQAQAHRGRPITIRPNETLEVQQSATAGTGNARVLCLFTVGGHEDS